jgi:hypothetical protein
VYRTRGDRTGCVSVVQRPFNLPCVRVQFSVLTSSNMKLARCPAFCVLFFWLEDEASSFVRNVGESGTRAHGVTSPKAVDLDVCVKCVSSSLTSQRLVSVNFLELADRVEWVSMPRFGPLSISAQIKFTACLACYRPATIFCLPFWYLRRWILEHTELFSSPVQRACSVVSLIKGRTWVEGAGEWSAEGDVWV